MVASLLIQITRIAVFAAFVLALLVAITQWAVRTRRLNPFGAIPRLVRQASEPILRPLERRIVRAGGNPVDAPLWLLGIVVVGGLVLITGVGWVIRTVLQLGYVAQSGPREMVRLVVSALFSLIMIALIVRVISSWFGVSPYSKWMRPVMALTDWIVEPLRRVIPPVGMFDLSPMVAYLLLLAARWVILSTI